MSLVLSLQNVNSCSCTDVLDTCNFIRKKGKLVDEVLIYIYGVRVYYIGTNLYVYYRGTLWDCTGGKERQNLTYSLILL